jgi:hypothetical protein
MAACVCVHPSPGLDRRRFEDLLSTHDPYKEKERRETRLACIPVARSSCSPNASAGIADAKKMYVAGASILHKRVSLVHSLD